MGQTLSEPITEKITSSGGNKQYIWSVSEMQGWRITMEDSHTTLDNMQVKDKTYAFFAVYDGHGGSNAAKYCASELYKCVCETDEFAKGDYKAALKQGFLTTDAKLLADPSGCTAVVILLADDTIYCANAGDSRAVLSGKGTAVALSHDHKPLNQSEYNRIVAAGGFVEFGRVNGNLALSRAIGDFEFKNNPILAPEQQIVTCDPEIISFKVASDHEFFVVACDGIWDVLTSQQVIDFVSMKIAEDYKLNEIVEAISDRCLATDSLSGVGCDNMTVIICGILNGKSEQEWRDQIKTRYEASSASTISA